MTNPGKPYKSFGDVIKAAKAKPDTVTYGSVGSGSLGHLAMTLLQQAGGFKLVHVPYKGGGPMTVEALGGTSSSRRQVALLTPHVKGGKLRAIATTGDKRAARCPTCRRWRSRGSPASRRSRGGESSRRAATPKPILDRFHAELVKVFNQPDVRKQLTETLGMDLVVSSPAELQKFVVAEIARWGKVVKEHAIKAE